MKTSKRLASLVAAVGLVAGATVMGSATTASATSQANRCGSGYGYLGSWPIRSGGGSGGPAVGYIDVYWSNYTGKNCVIARPVNGIANPSHIFVRIGTTTGSGWAQTDGLYQNYVSYAGPVYVYAPSCIDFQGGFDYTDRGYGAYAEGWYDGMYC